VKLHEFHSPEHKVTYNGPNTHQDTIEDMTRKITKRAASLLKLETIILNAWDVCHPTEGKHTVMTEAVQKFTFNDDPDAKPVEIGDLSIMELEKAPEGKGFKGMWIVQGRGYLDATPIRQKRMEIAAKKQAQTTA
jgi:hypothetical protein